MNRNEKRWSDMITPLTLVQIALIAGIIALASGGHAGWGWLVFILFCTL